MPLHIAPTRLPWYPNAQVFPWTHASTGWHRRATGAAAPVLPPLDVDARLEIQKPDTDCVGSGPPGQRSSAAHGVHSLPVGVGMRGGGNDDGSWWEDRGQGFMGAYTDECKGMGGGGVAGDDVHAHPPNLTSSMLAPSPLVLKSFHPHPDSQPNTALDHTPNILPPALAPAAAPRPSSPHSPSLPWNPSPHNATTWTGVGMAATWPATPTARSFVPTAVEGATHRSRVSLTYTDVAPGRGTQGLPPTRMVMPPPMPARDASAPKLAPTISSTWGRGERGGGKERTPSCEKC